jgi:hypothetical protein
MELATPRRWLSRVGTASVVALLVVLAVLWGVSYFGAVWVTGKLPGPYDFSLQAFRGSIGVSLARVNSDWSATIATWVDGIGTEDGSIRYLHFHFGYVIRPHEFLIRFPFWLPVCLCTAILWYPRRSTRFSLRAFLATTVLVALVVGLIVALPRVMPHEPEPWLGFTTD